MYSVKEVSSILQLTEHTIRYYTDQKLVPNLQRDKHNNRIFNDESINWLQCIKHLRKCGMSVENIKAYIDLCLKGDSTIRARYEIMKKQRSIAFAQLEEAQQRAQYIDNKANNYLDFINNVISDDNKAN
ncbi:MerR family transcriptional regulator [Paraliobacillus salinarum]|uniref:MerR family transcriptional regulator n=1 Tax=Paraliobacillus salinarum TaxID=1158996 RepID=UPI0015F6F3E7|nr:MerR family transcriptional regulator [Paraliobacillus salinarum]